MKKGSDLQAILDTSDSSSPSRFAVDVAIEAQTDAEAVAAWLRAKAGRSMNTFDSYKREATRLLLWLEDQGLSLNDMKVDHAHAFFKLLAAPPARWCRPKTAKPDITLGRTQVLGAALSNRSIAHTRTVLSQLLGYLQDAGFVQRNVFRLSAKPLVLTETIQTRLLDLDGWSWLRDWLEAMPKGTRLESAHASRCRWLLNALYHTGLRREEIASGQMGDFVRRNRAWSLRVIGKGYKERFVTINSVLLGELVTYRRTLGLADYPVPGEDIPLVVSVSCARQSKRMTPRAIGMIIERVSESAARDCEDPHLSEQFKHMTTHWLRHTNATHRLLAGASLETTQDELGHADPRTTRIYAKTSDTRRSDDAEKLALLGKKTS